MITLTLARPWLIADLGQEMRVLSFAPWRPGFATARRILWREVRNADLTPDLDVDRWFAAEMARQGATGDIGMLTSRDIGRHFQMRVEVEGIAVTCIATVGLGNAEAVGARRGRPPAPAGTINLAVVINAGLTETAQLEALTIVAEARTAAVMDSGLRLGNGARATGTGTDCIALACLPGQTRFAGLHTALGEATGRAVRDAVATGAADWIAENGGVADGYPP